MRSPFFVIVASLLIEFHVAFAAAVEPLVISEEKKSLSEIALAGHIRRGDNVFFRGGEIGNLHHGKVVGIGDGVVTLRRNLKNRTIDFHNIALIKDRLTYRGITNGKYYFLKPKDVPLYRSYVESVKVIGIAVARNSVVYELSDKNYAVAPIDQLLLPLKQEELPENWRGKFLIDDDASPVAYFVGGIHTDAGNSTRPIFCWRRMSTLESEFLAHEPQLIGYDCYLTSKVESMAHPFSYTRR